MAFKMKGAPYGSPVKYKKSPVKDKKEAWAGKMEDGTPEWDHEAYAHNRKHEMGKWDDDHKEKKSESDNTSPNKMKSSPAKDTKWVGFPEEHDPDSRSKKAHNRRHEMDPKWDHKENKSKEVAKGAAIAGAKRATEGAKSPNKQKDDEAWGPEKTEDKKGWEDLSKDEKKQKEKEGKAGPQPGRLRIDKKGNEAWGPEKNDSGYKNM